MRGGRNSFRLHPELRVHAKNLRHDSEMQRKRRYNQMMVEETKVRELESEGWVVFSPTAVCDRIGIKDGQVYLIEFKKKGGELTSGQKVVKDLVPYMYKIFYLP